MSDSANPQAAKLTHMLQQALACHQKGQWSQALGLYEAVLALDANNHSAWQLLGVLYAQTGQAERAISCMERSLLIEPAQAGVLVNLGNALRSSGRPLQALARYDLALQLVPDNATTYLERARALLDLLRFAEAVSSADASLSAQPLNPDALSARGMGLAALFRFDEALASFRRALEISPGHLEALLSFAGVAHEIGLNDQSIEAAERAVRLVPESLRARVGQLLCLLPALADTPEESRQALVRYQIALSEFSAWISLNRHADPETPISGTPTFYLAYQTRNNVDLLARFGSAWCDYLQSWAQRWGVPPKPRKKVVDRRLRVGIVTAYVRDHSVFHAITRTLLTALKGANSEILLFSLANYSDEVTTYAAAQVDRCEHGTKSLNEWVGLIGTSDCDVLVYPEVGLDVLTLKLAGMRLAPVQVASWGHPASTGLPSIDYYLTAAAFEPEDRHAHYTEQLVVIDNLGCHLTPGISRSPAHYASLVHKPSMGLNENCPTFLCPGTPFKYTPETDEIFVKIAQQAGPCQFVFFEFQQRAELSRRMFSRLAKAFSAADLDWTRYLQLLPWLPPDVFRALCANSAAVLDTVGFSGFNTAVNVLESGAPMVAWEGAFMRGRLASGTLAYIGLEQLIARSVDQYVNLSTKLALDPEFSREARAQVVESRAKLYRDDLVSDQLMGFFQSLGQ